MGVFILHVVAKGAADRRPEFYTAQGNQHKNLEDRHTELRYAYVFTNVVPVRALPLIQASIDNLHRYISSRQDLLLCHETRNSLVLITIDMDRN
jgi:hypothetical protein